MARQNVTQFTRIGLGALVLLASQAAFADITGTVFRDYDADGVTDTGEPGLGGITVTAYNAAGTTVATATTFDQVCSAAATPVAACTAANTPALGSYTLVIASGGPFRVEFTGEGSAFATAAFGTNNPTSVQFVATSTATVNAGFNNPAQYCAGPTSPAVVAAFFAFGNPAPGLPTLFGFDYDARGTTHDADPVAAGVQAQREYGLSDQTGAVYGIAYQRRTQSLFSSSYVHRGSPQGPDSNTGTIYRSPGVTRNTTGIAATPFITVNGMAGIDTGTNPHPTGTDWTRDAAAYGVVGKRGLGDLEISEDGLTLYTTNLLQREVLVLPIGTGPTAPTAAQIVRVPVPVPASCSGATPSAGAPSIDDIRPFATKFFDGTLYVGMVCTAQSMRGAGATLAAAKVAMRGYVYAMNPTTNTFSSTPIIEFPLNYPRQFLNSGIGSATTDGEWNPWNDTYQPPGDFVGNAGFWLYPQPILTDIEFDGQGRMAIGLRDRLADQTYDSGELGPAGDQNDSTRQGGDLLLACRGGAGGAWVLENAGGCGTSATSDPASTGAGTNINSGPGNREFYWEEYYDFDFAPDFHRETAMGSLLWRPGSGNFMSTVFDVDGTFNAGVRVYRNDNGANARLAGNVRHEYRLYEDGTSTFGKAGGIGDIEILCEESPVQIGNRVWRDSNGNGRQDPGEPPIANVVINLYNAAGAQIGSTTTDANGHFLFLFSIGATDPSATDNTIIQPNPFGANVTLLVAPSNFTAGNPLAGFTRTLANTGGALRDSNGIATTVAGGGPSGTGFIATVGAAGRNDHTIDFGFGIADFGDLPDTAAGSGVGNYSTLASDNGAMHTIVPGLQMGATVDGESDGQPGAAATGDDTNGAPDDEDGVTVADLALRVATAANVRINATNTTGAPAQLCGFIDFNGDGDFADAGESAAAVAVPTGSNNVQFTLAFGTVPAGSAASTYARFRLSDTIAACTPNGAVGAGEVEDYPVGITPLDFGDLPDTAAGTSTGNYNTQEADNGANHRIVTGLFMGASVDAEANGQQSLNANGDDTNGAPDDEDGITVADLQFVTGSPATVRVNATNLTATAATLCGFVDFNGDGDFLDAGETAPGLPVATGTNNVLFTLNFGTAPVGVATTYARFRLSSPTGACVATGFGGDGEVEDYPAGVIPVDMGDLPDTTAGIGNGNYSTLRANNGPRHPRTATAPRLGATVDTEADGQPNAGATGDGADEDGVTIPALNVGANATVTAVATNPAGAAAQLCGFLDFNGDGDFADAGETAAAVNVPAGTSNGSFPINFGTVPVGAASTTYARFRITTGVGACTPDGLATDGEVEDYVVNIGTLDFGDLPAPLYPTLLAGNGARHPIVSGLVIGAAVDAEADGQPNAAASGDDANGTPDDEDGVTVSDLSLIAGSGASVRVNATNTTGSAAQLCGFIDFNGDGDFLDANETAPAAAVANGSNNVQFTLNFGTVPTSVATSTYARFRLSTDIAACTAAGVATNGEVEDYPVAIGLVDLGDLPDTGAGSGNGNYSTLLADNGPRHPVVAGLRLGANEDGEADGQPSANANGDDANGVPDDEDGVTVADLALVGGSPANVRVNATNTTGAAAQLCGFIDFNADGDFADAGETAPAVAVATGSNNVQFTLAFGTVPGTAATSTYARFRLSTAAGACTANGAAPDGEVEDYAVGISQTDFGDLPDTGAGSGNGNYSTLLADNGPRHPIVAGLRLGAEEDGEADGVPGTGANGDDTAGTPDDEDGINTADLALTAGTTATVRATATNTLGTAAQLCGFIDFNADGDFADAGETAPAVTVPAGSNGAPFTLNFGTVPTSVATSSYARFRLSTDAGPCSPTGAATDGEVEDYPVSAGLLDFGDLPDGAAGTGVGNYATLLADDGPRHPIVAGLRLGTNEDGEAEGQPSANADGDDTNGTPDDEDGVTIADLSLTGGTAATVRVNATNTTGTAAQLCGFVDFNGDGDFADAGETAPAVAVATGSNNVQFSVNFGTVPTSAVSSTYARFRLSTDAGACTATGIATNGEVEDYPVGIAQIDFGDLPDTGTGSGNGNYSTLLSDNGPRHPIVAGLRLGTNEDGEADGQPGNGADTDDTTGTPDDEDGVTVADLVLTAGTTANVRVNATNTTGAAAQLCGFMDFNADGDFADAGETTAAAAVPNGSNDVQFTLNFGTVPITAAASSYARFRLSTDAGACTPNGAATDGEVEDYAISVGQLDFGDLPDTGAGSGNGNYSTLLADNGPRHPIIGTLFLGATEDGEADGQPGVAANGDGADEDGVTLADLNLTAGSAATIRVVATNTSGSTAQLCGFVDFNGDGDFADAGEATFSAVPNGTNGATFPLAFAVPATAVTASYARFRLSTDTGPCSPVGAAPNGEVEDYPVGITVIDFGDLPDTGAGSGNGNYSTLLADNGARHPIIAGLRIGANEDAEANGQPGAAANGDDTNGAPDDEDGVTTTDLALSRGVAPNVRVTATNTTGSAALLCGFLDYNADGDFADAGEAAQVAVPNGSNAALFTLTFGTVPNTAAAASYARFRLSTDGACTPNGAATNGEVEDYPITTGAGVLSLGNLVWNDRNNDGRVNGGETGISGVAVALYRDSDNNGTPDGPAIATTNTDGTGNYLFGALDPDTYLVEIVPPAGYRTSTGSGLPPLLPTGTFEPAPDPDNDVNDDDNGTLVTTTIRSAPVTLAVGAEPVNDGDADANSNLSVDFGLLGNFDFALRKIVTTGQPGPFIPGSDVSFDIEVINQGAIAATTIVVNDYIPAGFALSPTETNWTSVSPTLATRTIAGPLAAGASTVVTIRLRVQNGAVSPLVNRAEIGSADDDGNTNTPPPLDIDSTPDGNPGNDAGGSPGSGSDDSVGGNGTGTPGGTDPNTDEDDADPAQITLGTGFDLALRKTLTAGQPGPFTPGSDVSFDIEVINQGGIQATTIVVNDYIPAGFALSPTETNWTSVSPTLATRTIAGPLAPGASTVVTIRLRIQNGAVSPLVNRAEIGSADDDGNSQTPPPTDIDSTPDGTPGNDAGGAPGTPSDDAVGGNGTGTPGGIDPATDEDDADPAQVTFGSGFDLALRKTLSAGQPGPFLPGQDVTFDITVLNQGTVQATTIVINDYIPAGFELSPTELNWNAVNASLATRTIGGPLLPGTSTTVTITLRILPTAVSPLVNRAEIGSADDDGDSQTPPPTDIDSTPDGNPNNDAGGSAGTPSDDAVGGNGTGTPGGIDPLTDEDDSDPAQITLGTPGGSSPLGLAKQAQVLSLSGGGGYGDGATPGTAQLAYVILVRNYGTQPVDSLQIVENLVTTFGAGTNWNVVSVTAPTLTVNPAYDGRGNTNLLIGSDSLAVGATTTVRLVVNVQFTPGAVYTNQVLGTGLVGSTPVSDLSHDGTDPAPGGGSSNNNGNPTIVRLGAQSVPALSVWSFGLLLLGLAGLAWQRQRRREQRA